ncbi:hypothetical protein [Noviherbaspirillum saxi]|uniref:Uncharacterized protein n=1 Tax=Noviherbaspirillum saxi TaxID=2320863 RepID=A0A3A3FSL5_9BURK|nr:hypothetical protein [Noviherbaspirillum saxi]RJF97478.1 hypothetical protein D3871_02240 [Noviherbaspirillum saxi]
MLYLTLVVPIFIIISLYMTVDSWFMKRPWVLLLMGFVTASFGLGIKAIPLTLKSFEASAFEITFLEIAASALDPTLLALAGGLIASAFILKIQHDYDNVSAENKESFARAEEHKNEAVEYANELARVRPTLSEEEYERRQRELEFKRELAIWAMQNAKAAYRRLEGRGWSKSR